MWWWARAFVLGLGLVVAGCGFRPLYGGGGESPVARQLAAIHVAAIPDRSGQELRNALEHRMATDTRQPARYAMEIALTEVIQELGVRKNLTASRANIRIKARWTLTTEGRVVHTGETEAIAAYNILDQQYATVTSEKDSRSRAVEQLANEIVRQLSVYFARADRPPDGTP
jgi:LPS-assembly lipoprotein